MHRRAEPGIRRGGVLSWRAAAPIARLLGRWWFPYVRDGVPVPEGPVVIAANHFSHLDPVIVGMAVDRPVRYLAVDELYGSSVIFDRLTLYLGAIPMSRTRIPFGALKLAVAELEAGRTIGVFPEGVRVWGWGERPPKRGGAWLARRSGVPLVPVALQGTDVAMGRGASGISRAPVRATVCQAILPADHDDADDPLASMMGEWVGRIDAALSSG